jgi:hypothetical protein
MGILDRSWREGTLLSDSVRGAHCLAELSVETPDRCGERYNFLITSRSISDEQLVTGITYVTHHPCYILVSRLLVLKVVT